GTYGDRGVVVAVPAGQDAERFAAALASADGVALAAPNGRIEPLWTPNDTLYPTQWNLPAIQMPAAWDVERGSATVLVAVVDTGVQLDHPDLAAGFDLSVDYDFAHGDDVAEDEQGHGTHVSGILAAVTDNAAGVAGIAPDVRLVPLKIMGAGDGSVSDLVDAIYYAADIGADVINMSVGEPLDVSKPGDAAEARMMQDAIDYAVERDVVLVGAAGNDGSTYVYYPAACDGVITVGATNRSNVVAAYSNHGPQVDIAAPGGEFGFPAVLANGINSTYLGSTYRYLAGTSMASPHVAAAAALLRSHAPAANAGEVTDSLLFSALDIGAVGWDEYSGHGLLRVADALAALEVASPNVTRLSGSNRYETALAASRTTFASGDSTVTVLASGEDFPDALAASGLAGAHNGALLLTGQAALPTGLAAELDRLGTAEVVVVGGTAAISPDVITQLMAEGFSVRRVQGADRYQTAAAVAEEIRDVVGTAMLSQAFLVRGDGYADALAVAPLAYSQRRPVLLTTSGSLAPAARTALESLGATGVVVAGGESAVSTAVLDEAAGLAGVASVVRWAGTDRYDTAAVVAGHALDEGLATADCFGVATGLGFPDALAGGAACGVRGGVVLLTDPFALPASTKSLIVTRGHDGTDIFVFGGTSVVALAVEDELARIRY
ncbi:MAG: S8 family serine peptidase, partial [Coriobacteriia bacterium]